MKVPITAVKRFVVRGLFHKTLFSAAKNSNRGKIERLKSSSVTFNLV